MEFAAQKHICTGFLSLSLAFTMTGCFGAKPSTSAPQDPNKVRSKEELIQLSKDPQAMKEAALFYHNVCSRCHGEKGEGGIGPNLTDEYWIYGNGDIRHLVQTIQIGAPDRGMPAWEAMNSQHEIELAAAYVFTLKGTQPKNAKAPQGQKMITPAN